MKNAIIAFLAAVVFSFAATFTRPEAPLPAQSAASRPPAQRLIDEVHRILGSMKSSEYSHKTRVDETKGEYLLDCSGLACYVLRRELPEHYQNISHGKGKARPLARDFYACFAAAPTGEAGRNGWRRISRLLDARPGDLIAWKSEPGAASTGHVMVVDAVPRQARDGQVEVVIIDSTSSRHGNDTRKAGQTGIGRGTIWFAVDAEGKPLGYRWGNPKGKLRERPIAVGRAVPLR